jgi:hypothetical protein
MGWRSAAAAVLLARAAAADEEAHLEPGVLPAAAYSSDTGLGLGVVGSLALVDPSILPYRFRIEAQLYASGKEAPGGGYELVQHDDYVVVEVPGLAGGALRLRGRLGFNRAITAGYYGVGNAATPDPARAAADPRYTEVDLLQTRLDLGARVRVRDALELFAIGRAGVIAVGVYPDSKLDEDRAGLTGVTDHGELSATVGVVSDTRDHEAWPHRGVLADASLRAGAGLGEAYGYGGATLAARAFLPLVGELALGARLVGDALWGEPAFDELTRVGGLAAGDATGGGSSLRGVPGGRYRGKIKLLSGLELRLRAPEWRIGSQRFHLGTVAFVDAGRVWSGLPPDPALDGSGLGLTVGIGGGLRLEWGETFVVRADLGYGPREQTTGLYIDVGQVF